MRHLALQKPVTIAFAAALFILVTASCGEQVLGPSEPAGPQAAQLETQQPVAMGAPSANTPRTSRGTSLTAREEISANVTPNLGGTVAIGRYSVEIPPGALAKTTKITIAMVEENGGIGCTLLPHGLVFRRPVVLRMRLTGTPLAAANLVTIYWLDEGAGKWVDLGASYDGVRSSVAAKLGHFSRYAAGRPGW